MINIDIYTDIWEINNIVSHSLSVKIRLKLTTHDIYWSLIDSISTDFNKKYYLQ